MSENIDIDIDTKNSTYNYELLKKICKMGLPNTEIDLSRLNNLIDKEILETLKKNAPPDFPERYYDFKYEYAKFKDFVFSKELINKKIVSVAGAFSTGKSSFLNSIFKKSILPSEINPSTSVPTYIINSDTKKVSGLNIFNYKMTLRPKDVKSISYGFGEVYNDETGKIINDEINIDHILKRLIIETPMQIYKNIAFLDTPGYTKSDNLKNTKKTDEQITKSILNSSDYIIWFISSDWGTIPNEDVKFLTDVKKEIPKLFIVNKADKLTNNELNAVVEQVRSTLHIKGVSYVDILTYSKRKPNEYDSKQIYELLESFNKAKYEESFAKNFKRLFVICKNYYENNIYNENRHLNKINTSITLIDNEIAIKNLKILRIDIKDKIKEYKKLLDDLNLLQNEFFAEIKTISDIVSIDMPVPSDVNFISESYLDYIQLLKNYKQKNNTKKIPNIFEEIKHYHKSLEHKKMNDNIYNNYNEIFKTIHSNCEKNNRNNENLSMSKSNYSDITSNIIRKNVILKP